MVLHGMYSDFVCYCSCRSGKVKQPEWVDLVKTGVYKELAPFDEDWFLIRMASLARHIYIRAPIGVKTAKRIYGGKLSVESSVLKLFVSWQL